MQKTVGQPNTDGFTDCNNFEPSLVKCLHVYEEVFRTAKHIHKAKTLPYVIPLNPCGNEVSRNDVQLGSIKRICSDNFIRNDAEYFACLIASLCLYSIQFNEAVGRN